MSEVRPLAAGLAELTEFFIGDTTMEDTLTRIAESAVEAIDVAAFIGLTMLIDGEPRTGVFTDPESPEIDQAQYDTGEGPCLEAFRTGEILRVDDTREAGRWPAFRRRCQIHGIHSTASFPMIIDDARHGAMNVYSHQDNAFGIHEIQAGRQFAAQAGTVIAYARSYWNARQLNDHMERAMSSRAEIEQAKGIIIATTGMDADSAFETLVRQSQHENRKVRDIALELIKQKTRRP